METTTTTGRSAENCAICLDTIHKKKTLKCLHSFCSQCIDSVFSFKPACPICNTYHGVYTGTQPEGTMTVTHSWQSLPGFEGYGTAVIQYTFPAGIQGVRLTLILAHTVCVSSTFRLLFLVYICPPEDSVVSFTGQFPCTGASKHLD